MLLGMNTDNATEALDPPHSKKPKTLHLEQELDAYDPYDHEALANEPC